MRAQHRFILVAAALSWCSVLIPGAYAQETPSEAWVRNVMVYDVASGEFSGPKDLVFREGRITDADGGTPPPGADVVDGTGLYAYPGFIDPWTTVGLTEVPSVSATVDTTEAGKWNAHLRAGTAINPHSAHVGVARLNGVLTVGVIPGGGALSGSIETIDLLGRTVPAMRVESAPPIRVLQVPRPPRRTYSEKDEKDWEKKRNDGWKDLEEALDRARRAGILVSTGFSGDLPGVSGQERLSLLAAAQHLEGHHPWLVWADDRDHILAALDFADKHGLRLVLAGMQEGWMVADRLATCGHQLVLGSPFQSPDDELPYDAVYANAAALHRAGCRFAITTRSSSDVRNLPYLAAMAVAHGLPRAVALRALTLHGAEALGISGDRGTLRVGQVANVLLYDGDPLDARVSPRHVFIRGTRIPLISRHTYLAEPYLPR